MVLLRPSGVALKARSKDCGVCLPLIKVILFSQVANGILLPFVLVFMLLLVNRKEVMGEYRNSRTANVIAWGTVATIIALTVALIFISFKPGGISL